MDKKYSVWDVYGVPQSGENLHVKCFHHEDSGRPNMVIFATNTFKCFSCGIQGDAIDMKGIMLFGDHWNPKDKKQFSEVINDLDNKTVVQKLPDSAYKIKNYLELTKDDYEFLSSVTKLYQEILFTKKGKQALEYLKDRGFSIETIKKYRLGYSDGVSLGLYFSSSKIETLNKIYRLGLIKNGREWLKNRITFPYLSDNGTDYLVGRDIRQNSKLRYLGLTGYEKPLYAHWDILPGQPIIIQESIPDSIIMNQLLSQFKVFSIAVSGTNISSNNLEYLKKLNNPIYILSQNDQQSKKAEEKWQISIPNAKTLNFEYKDKKDINEFYSQYGEKEIVNCILSQIY